jgi:hypothetical protein
LQTGGNSQQIAAGALNVFERIGDASAMSARRASLPMHSMGVCREIAAVVVERLLALHAPTWVNIDVGGRERRHQKFDRQLLNKHKRKRTSWMTCMECLMNRVLQLHKREACAIHKVAA